MPRTAFASVDEYIASQPEAIQRVLTRVRRAIRQAVPASEESISYNIPTYKVNGSAMLYFAGWKRHYSLYPVTKALASAFEDELEPYEVEKGTIRFPLTGPVPAELIGRIAKFRATESGGRKKAKDLLRKKSG